MRLYYSIHGDCRDGYRLDVYQYVPDRYDPKFETITTLWSEPRSYETFEDLLLEVNKLRLLVGATES